jgi:hypothetical protein
MLLDEAVPRLVGVTFANDGEHTGVPAQFPYQTSEARSTVLDRRRVGSASADSVRRLHSLGRSRARHVSACGASGVIALPSDTRT